MKQLENICNFDTLDARAEHQHFLMRLFQQVWHVRDNLDQVFHAVVGELELDRISNQTVEEFLVLVIEFNQIVAFSLVYNQALVKSGAPSQNVHLLA